MNVSPKKLSQFSKKELDAVFACAKVAFKKNPLTILYAPRQRQFGRILIITPKRIGSAPVRNRLRRQVKAIFYENKFFNSLYDWVIITRPEIVTMEYDSLKNLLLKILSLP